MRYTYAIAACIGLFVLYTLIAANLGWKHGGGVIPILIFFGSVVWTWNAITKNKEGD
jgi:hypothetical protein